MTVTTAGDLSYAQLKGVWLDAAKGTKYATNAWASLMAAIAEAESGGNPTATNPTDNGGTQTSWGLWQISLGNHAAPAPNWADPAENAKLAIGKLNGQGLTAWGTYNSGAYQGFLSDKTSADTSGLTAGPTSVQTAAATTAANTQADCAWNLGIPWLGNVCLLSRSQVRALVGAAVLVTGGVIMGGGLILIAAAAGLKVIGPVAAAIPGAEPVAAAAAVVQPRPARPQGTLADRRGTSPEFRRQYGLSA